MNELIPIRSRWLWACVLAGAITGCGREAASSYRVPKESPPLQAEQVRRADLPAGWEEAPPGEMRVASFHVKGENGKMADVSVIPLPGMAGHDLDNVNRWRGQVGLPPITEDELPKLTQPVEIGGQPARLYELAGSNPNSGEKERLLAAILRREGVPWFFKMVGDDALVMEQKPAFLSYLKSFNFPGGPEEAAAQTTQLPPSHPPIGTLRGGPPAGGESVADPNKPDWQVPSGWNEVSHDAVLTAKFMIKGADNSVAAVNVSTSRGDGGGWLSNVNRWRSQLGLNSWSETEAQQQAGSIDIAGGKAILVDMAGTDARTGQKARLTGAMIQRAGQAWFYKLMGSPPLVEQQKDAFIKFIQTAKYQS